MAAEQASGDGEPPRSLLALSEPLLLRVLCFLCPDDLLAASCTCRQMHVAASDCAIWRRLYHSRWPEGPLQEDAEHVQGVTWKTIYMERDERVVAEARHTAPSQELLPIYTQARQGQGRGGGGHPVAAPLHAAAAPQAVAVPCSGGGNASASCSPARKLAPRYQQLMGDSCCSCLTQMAAAKRSEALRDVESLFRSSASSRSQQLSSKVGHACPQPHLARS